MPLVSEEDLKIITGIPGYSNFQSLLVMTDAIEVVDDSGAATFYSKPGGKQVDFIHLASKIGKRQWNQPGTYSIVVYYSQYYSRDSVVDKNDACACELPGEQWLHDPMLILMPPFTPQKMPSRNLTRSVSGHLYQIEY